MTPSIAPARAVPVGLGSLSTALVLPLGSCRACGFAGDKSPVSASLWLAELLLVNRQAVMGGFELAASD